MPDATHITLREQVHAAIHDDLNNYASTAATDAVMAVFAERERVLREQIVVAVLAECDAMWGDEWATGTRDRLARAVRGA